MNQGKFAKLLIGLIATLVMAACAHKDKKTGEAEKPTQADIPVAKKSAPDAGSSIEAKQLAATEQATYVAEIQFAKKKAELSAASKEHLKKIFDQASAQGTIGGIKSIAWADSEFPSVHTVKLSKSEIALANNRNKSIEVYFKTLMTFDVNTFSAYSMAERSGLIADLFGSADARIKKSLEVAGIPNTDTASKPIAKASKAIVMVFLKEK